MDKEKIKEIRVELKMTQEAFARHLGISIRTVAGWEAGRSNPRGLYLQKLLLVKGENDDQEN
jgi:DNA-binding transcriptional regulator YiaG